MISAAHQGYETEFREPIIFRNIKEITYGWIKKIMKPDKINALIKALQPPCNMDIIIDLFQDDAFDVNQYGRCGITPLYLVIQAQHKELLKLFLSIGANPNQACEEALPLHHACATNNVEIVKILLEDTRTKDYFFKEKGSALHIAAKLGNLEMVHLLLEHGANPNLTSQHCLSADCVAWKNGYTEIQKILKEAISRNQKKQNLTFLKKESFHDFPLMGGYDSNFITDVKTNNLKAVTNSLKRGTIYDPNHITCSTFSTTALHEAVALNSQSLVELLIQKGSILTEKCEVTKRDGIKAWLTVAEYAKDLGYQDIAIYLDSVKEIQLNSLIAFKNSITQHEPSICNMGLRKT